MYILTRTKLNSIESGDLKWGYIITEEDMNVLESNFPYHSEEELLREVNEDMLENLLCVYHYSLYLYLKEGHGIMFNGKVKYF